MEAGRGEFPSAPHFHALGFRDAARALRTLAVQPTMVRSPVRHAKKADLFLRVF